MYYHVFFWRKNRNLISRVILLLVVWLIFSWIFIGGSFKSSRKLIAYDLNFYGSKCDQNCSCEFLYEGRGQLDPKSIDYKNGVFRLTIDKKIGPLLNVIPQSIVSQEYCGKISGASELIEKMVFRINSGTGAIIEILGSGEEICVQENIKEKIFLDTKIAGQVQLDIAVTPVQQKSLCGMSDEQLNMLHWKILIERRLTGGNAAAILIYILAFPIAYKAIQIAIRIGKFIYSGNAQ